MAIDNIVDEIKNRCNIVDVIGRQVVLKKTGSNHKGLCPFHNEKTPSFMVSEDKQIFTCFGCGATGDVIEFVQRSSNLDFHGAIEKLAAEYGIDLSGSGFGGEEKKTALYEINREAAAYFYRVFTQSENKGYAYMQRRGIEPSTLRKFGVGYADESWDSLYYYMSKKGISQETLLSLGLISQSKGKLYDKYRERVMFPIINTRGKVIGFGGRAIGDGTPKYLNSPESSIFLKKNNLYGLNLTRQDINREDCAILVEGYMDVLSLYQHGVRNVSASLGTALTENQAAMLKRYTRNIVLSYDGDAAGQAAALRGMDILQSAGCKVRVLSVEGTGAKDPDEFIKENGKEAFLALVKQAKAATEYKLDLLRSECDMETTEGSVAFLQKAAEILRPLSPVEADAYIKRIAAETHISEGAIRMEAHGESYGGRGASLWGGGQTPAQSGGPAIRGGTYGAEDSGKMQDRGHILLEWNLIKLMLIKSSYVQKIEPYGDVFITPASYRIYEVIRSLYREDEEIDLNQLNDSLEEEDRRMLLEIETNIQLADKDEEIFEDCINKIRITAERRREDEIIKLLSILEDEKDREAIEDLTRELMEIRKVKNQGGIRR